MNFSDWLAPAASAGQLLLLLLGLMAVAGVANMAAVACGRRGPLARFDQPVWARVFGANKTWRGLVIGCVSGGATALLAGAVAVGCGVSLPFGGWVGAAVGLATMLGDLATSGYKRLRRLPPGAPHWSDPFDPAFGVGVGLLAVGWPMSVALYVAVAAALLLRFIHPAVAKTGHRLGLKARPH